MSNIDDIKKLLGTPKMIIGSDRVLKELRNGKLAKIYLAQNPPIAVKNDISEYSELAKVEVIELDVPNDELGTLCKKPFAISVIGVLA